MSSQPLPEGGPGLADQPALRRCTAVAPAALARRVGGREGTRSRAAELPSDFSDLFSLAAADRLLSQQGLRTPFLRVARDGSTLPSSRFTTGGGVGAGVPDQVSDVKLTSLFAGGSTIVLQALHRMHAPIISFAQTLGADLGHPVQVNAYLTPAQSQGFSAHYDVHDVFVLQIAGEKRWAIHRPVHPAPLRDQPWTDHRSEVSAAASGEPLIDEVLRPGDALYLPRGYLHAATALGEMTAHLTIGIHVWTRRHLLEKLLALSGDAEELRATLPLGVDVTSGSSLAAEIAATAKAFASIVDSFEPDQVARLMAVDARSSAKAEPVAPLAQAAAAATVSLGDKLRWRAALPVTVTADGDQLLIQTTDGPARVPGWAEPSLDLLRSGGVLPVADLAAGPSTTDSMRLELAATLLRTCLTVLA